MLANGPQALAQCIDVVNRGVDVAIDEALALEAAAFGLLTATADMREGTSAFLEKRAPVFRGS
jgi:enoyl-CoA hydratase